MQTDMTVGKPMKMLLNFTIPVFLGNVFQQLYSMADAVIVGKFVGTKGLAAVGATGTITFLIIGFLMGVTTGVTVLTSQKFGAGRMDEMRKTVGNAAILSAVIAVVMTAVSMLGMHRLLVFMHTPEDIFDGAYGYIMIICAGIFTQVLYNLVSSILRALGNSKTPLYFLILAAGLNIVLDLVLVRPMGVAGTAWATIIAQGISGFLCLFYMKKKFTILTFQREDWKLHKHYVINLCNMGIPMGLQYSITAIGSVILQTAVNGLGSTAVASVTASGKISMFCCCPFDALGSTMATYAGQNVGAKKMDRVNTGILTSSIIGSVYSVVILGVMFLWSRQISLLFVDASETVILDQARQMLLINMVFYIPLTLVNVVRFTVQGMGFSKFAILAGVCEMIGRSVVAFFLVPYFGYTAVCFASPVAWILADLFLVPAYLYCAKTLRSLFEKNAQMM